MPHSLQHETARVAPDNDHDGRGEGFACYMVVTLTASASRFRRSAAIVGLYYDI